MKILLLLFISFSSIAGVKDAQKIISLRMNYDEKLKSLVSNLVQDKLYFSAIPWIKELLVRGKAKSDSRFEKDFSDVLKNTGSSHFETLPIEYLRQSNLNSIKYILGKKLIKQSDSQGAIQYLESISPNHSIYPFALNALATVYSVLGQFEKANLYFNQCVSTSDTKSSNTKLENKQIMMNHDYCLLGIARNLFAAKDYKNAELKYLDIPKSSPVWPYVLFDEAWNSYYLKNYNRTLGKLVTYKAPIFKKFFNPEFDVLKALSYLKMCLYEDAKFVSDDFYKNYMDRTRKLRVLLKSRGQDYNYFYKLSTDFDSKNTTGNTLLDSLLDSFQTDGAIENLKSELKNAYREYLLIKKMSKSKLKLVLLENTKDVIQTQRRLIGSYVRSRLIEKYAELYKGFEGMSYIKLEILAQRKARLYSNESKKEKRGDIKYLERNDKQYFWNFNGEFWADELGDYVFALRSEC